MLARLMTCIAMAALLLPDLTLRAQGAAPTDPAAAEKRAALAKSTTARPSAIERLDQSQTAMREARGRSDWTAYRLAAQQLEQLLNGSPQSRLELARAEIRAGHAPAALDELNAYARMGQASEVVETLPDFASLRALEKFAAVRASMVANRKSVALASVAFEIPDSGLLPEDIDFDPHSQRFFISSVLQHRIVTLAADQPLVEFARAPDDWPILAIKIDAERHVLWATAVALEGFEAVVKADQGRSAVLCYDLNTGKLLQRVEGPRPSALGDIVLTARGEVIASDGSHGGLYRLEPGARQLERLDRGEFISPQTAALARDAAHIYVPDYVRGLGEFNLETRQVRWFPMEGRFALQGIDGLYRVGEKLIGVQNGASPARIVLFPLDTAAAKIVAEQVIERATATLGDPTHGVVVGDAFYYIANAGWGALGDNGLVKSGATLSKAVVMQWQLPRQ
jgi:hypothetical protein